MQKQLRTAARLGATTAAVAAVALGGTVATTTVAAPQAQAASKGITKGMAIAKTANVKVKKSSSKHTFTPAKVRLAKNQTFVSKKVSVKKWDPKVKSWIATNKRSVTVRPGHYWVATTVKYKVKGSSKIRTARQADGAWVTVKKAAKKKAVAAPSSSRLAMWNRVAKCESTNNWKIANGNGYYGGLQFSYSTWLAYGGGKYGKTANRASKTEQIAIAEKVLKGQGAGAWGSCGRKAGLRR